MFRGPLKAVASTSFTAAAPDSRNALANTDTPRHGTETHRLLINLNAGFEDEYGGRLVLLDVIDP